MAKQTHPIVERAQVQFPETHNKYANRLGIVQSIDGDNVTLRVLNQSDGEIVSVKASEFTVIAPPDEESTHRTRGGGTKKAAKRSTKRASKKGGK